MGELTRDILTLDVLRALADEGRPQALVEGTGIVYGSYVINSLSETKKELFNDGTPRMIEFQLQLTRVDDKPTEVAA
jgi:uncharacterized protein